MPGVSVRGGSNVITLPSFGSDANQPTAPGRSSVGNEHHGPDITVVATSRSGGAFNFYGALKGDKVYTIYLNTTIGTAVMQFADPTSATKPYAEDLTAPEPLRAELPAGLNGSRLVIACILDRSGLLRKLQVLESGGEMTAKVLAALPNWKFRPVMPPRRHGENNKSCHSERSEEPMHLLACTGEIHRSFAARKAAQDEIPTLLGSSVEEHCSVVAVDRLPRRRFLQKVRQR
jgi:hypothetical protein